MFKNVLKTCLLGLVMPLVSLVGLPAARAESYTALLDPTAALAYELDPEPQFSTLDITNNKVVVKTTDLAAGRAQAASIKSQLILGRNGGTWDGTQGIVSSTAAADVLYWGYEFGTIGMLLNSDLAALGYPVYTEWGGRSVGLYNVLYGYTYGGDANLDGEITQADFDLYQMGRSGASPSWVTGDFDYSGTVNEDDYAILEYTSMFLGFTPDPVLAPEPSSLVLLLTGAALFAGLARSRHRHY